MALPEGGPTTDAAVRELAKTRAGEETARSVRVTAAVNGFVRTLPSAQVADGMADWTHPDVQHVVEGATMLGARLMRRKNSIDGAQATGVVVAGEATADADIAMLLGLGDYAPPMVG